VIVSSCTTGMATASRPLASIRTCWIFWSDDIPGRVVKVALGSNDWDDLEWGFRIDRLADGEPQASLAESPHFYDSDWSKTWTLVNPNPAASFTKVHFARLDLSGGDSVVLYDGNGNASRPLARIRTCWIFGAMTFPVVSSKSRSDLTIGMTWSGASGSIGWQMESRRPAWQNLRISMTVNWSKTWTW
jgi:hypothetical protein